MRWIHFTLILFALFAVGPTSAASTKSTTAKKCTTLTQTKCTAIKVHTARTTVSKTITQIKTTTLTRSGQIKTITTVLPGSKTTVTISRTQTLAPTTSTVTQQGPAQTVTTRLPGSTFTTTISQNQTIVSASTSIDLQTTTISSTATRSTTITSVQTVQTCAPTHVNLIPNGGFEYELDGWIPSIIPAGASISSRCGGTTPNDWVYSGKCAIAALFTTPTSQEMTISRKINFCAWTRYRVSFVWKITSSCTMEYYFGRDGTSAGTNGNTGSPAQWGQAETTQWNLGDLGAGFQSADYDLYFRFRSGGVGNCGISMDDLVIEGLERIKAKRDEQVVEPQLEAPRLVLVDLEDGNL